ncbi:DUF4245 domain-containing protein [Phaeacidiphilus oryzae]|uniref:DUF4245 domain-containing protein n=1 Tax=Phaeacidiphilus oryzae TaxID=348818 RepID=UPI001F2F28D5|nr:DUF4245 domain-containing protein [Phaeacidiphilus oryzae]
MASSEAIQSPQAAAPSEQTPPKRKGMLSKSSRDMVLSLIAVLAFGAVIYAFIPHSGKSAVHEISYRDSYLSAKRAAPYPILEPAGLSSGYRATSVDYDPSASTWHLGFIDPGGQYVALEQSGAPAGSDRQSWFADVTTNAARSGGAQTVGGQQWARYQGDRYRALVRQEAKDTVVVTGTESWAQLARFAAALK